MKKPTLHLVDGSSYLFRAYHALPPLANSRGEPTGAMYGVLNMLRKWIKDEQPELMAVVMDAPGKTFRDDMYPEYKANRPPMPDDLRAQLPPLLEIIEASGIPLLKIPDVEADDVLATLARRAAAEKRCSIISTSDKDLAQLVDDHVLLVNTMSNTRMDAAGVKEKFGVRPDQIIDYLTLVGDSVDNVPGVEKVGPKTAAKWLDKYDTLEAIMADADSFGGKIGGYLREALTHLPLSKELVTVRDTVELDVDIDDLVIGQPDRKRLKELYEHWEFGGWLRELLEEMPAERPQVEYELIRDTAGLERWIDKLSATETIAVDTETDALDAMQSNLVGISIAVGTGDAAYIPVGHRYLGVPEQLPIETVLSALAPIFDDAEKVIVGQHFKYDLHVLRRHGLASVAAYRYDTMLESYVLNSTGSRHDMDSLAEQHLGRGTIKFEEVAGSGAKQISFADVDLDRALDYAAEDADVTLQIHEALLPRLLEMEGPASILNDLEMPLVPVLARMEALGVLIDRRQLEGLSVEFNERMEKAERQAHDVAGEPFNLGSTKQLGEILFEKMELPVLKKTPGGKPSTAEAVLADLANDYELPALIMEYRMLSKLKSTYSDKLPMQINPETGRVHTSYHQAVAATGRLASSDPNLQNIPIRTEEGRRIRQTFIAPPDYCVVAADYSQIELRIMAHLSRDPGLVHAFSNDIDVHTATAAEVFCEGVLSEVTTEHRRAAKAINFGLMYGMTAFGLAKQLDASRTDAQKYIDTYFARYPGVKTYMEDTRAQARDQGYVETVFGRRLYLAEINSRNWQRRQGAERAAINAPMQGTAADIIKKAMLAVDEWIQNRGDDQVRMTMQVHDELVFEVQEDAVDKVKSAVIDLMENVVELSVPLVVEAGHGSNWDEAH